MVGLNFDPHTEQAIREMYDTRHGCLEVSEQQEARPAARRRIQKFGFMLCLLLVVIGTVLNVAVMFGWSYYAGPYASPAPLYISTLVLCLAVIVGLLALMAEE